MKHRSTLISVVTFASVIIAVHFIWGWPTLLAFWQVIPAPYMLAFTLLYWFSYLVRSLRISRYFASPQHRMPTRIVLPIVVKQTFWANLLPAKAGEISFPILMKKAFATPYTHSVPALLVLRLFDAYVVATIAIALFSYHTLGNWVYGWLVIAFFLPLIGISLKRGLIGLSYRFRRKPKMLFIWRIVTNIPDAPTQLLIINGLSWLNWAVKIGLFTGLLASMTGLSVVQTAIPALLGEISGMLPGLPGGFGSYEAAVSYGLITNGGAMSRSADIVGVALNAHFFILFNSILGAMIAFLLPSQPLNEPKL